MPVCTFICERSGTTSFREDDCVDLAAAECFRIEHEERFSGVAMLEHDIQLISDPSVRIGGCGSVGCDNHMDMSVAHALVDIVKSDISIDEGQME
ncbi:MAG: hypothetical protein AAGI13_07710 [Pseudomonadota bacterium]